MIHRVLGVKELTPGVVLIRLSREGLRFRAGQHLLVFLPGTPLAREYSIASGEAEPWLDILVRVVPGGQVSPRLARLRPGQAVEVSGPCGYFTPEGHTERVLVATGTGIAPFWSFWKSSLAEAAVTVHGVRTVAESRWAENPPARYVACVSREAGGDFCGRVTDWVQRHLDRYRRAEWWLCGNGAMVRDCWRLLLAEGVPTTAIHTEVYF